MDNKVIISKSKIDNLVNLLNNKSNTSGQKSLDDISNTINNLKIDNGQLIINANTDLTFTEYIFANTEINSIKFNDNTINRDTYPTEIPEERATEDCFTWNGTTITGLTGVGTTWLSEHNGAMALPDKCTSITGGFNGRKDLITIYIPATVTTIGEQIFADCTNLTTVRFYGTLAVLNYRTFFNCTSLTNVTLPTNLTTIGEAAFYICTSLTNITLPDSITHLSNASFQNCTSLTNVALPANLTTIGNFCFRDCTKLVNIDTSKCTQLKTIGLDFCMNDSALESIELPDSIESIGSAAFYNCTSLRSAKLPKNEKYTELVCAGGDYGMFFNCRALTTITIPSYIKIIGLSCFNNCTSLESVIFEENSQLTTLRQRAFFSCSSLTSITLPANLTTIDNGCFQRCTFLVKIDISKHTALTTFGDYAFAECPSLKNFDMPNLIEQVGCSLFVGDTNLTSINITTNEKVTNLFTDGRYNVNGCFADCASLVSITIPPNIKVIDSYCFNGCTSLKTVYLPNSINTINLNSFYNTPSDLVIYYNGNEEEFNSININTNNTDLFAKTKVYNYSTTWNSDIYKVEGYCGPSVKYRIQLNENKMYISGSGATGNYLDEITTSPSFNPYKNDITSIFFTNKYISKIGKNTFNNLTNVTDIYFVGTEDEFNNIIIETGNDIITSATKHYETIL